MKSHTNESDKRIPSRPNGDKKLLSETPADIQIEDWSITKNSHFKAGIEAVQWQKLTETDSCIRFKVGKSSSSSSPDTPDPTENIKLADKASDCALKAASVCRLVADLTYDAIDVGKKLLENSLRKGEEVNSRFTSDFISVAEKYKVAVDRVSEKADEADGAVRIARIAGSNALKAAKSLSGLIDVESKDAKNANFQATWAIAAARRAKTDTYRTACTTLDTMKIFWEQLCSARNEEISFNRNVDGQLRKRTVFVNSALAFVLLLGCLAVALKNCFSFVKESYVINTGVTLIVGSIMGFVINAQNSNVEGVAQTEKMRKVMAATDERLHRLVKYFEKNKFTLETFTSKENLAFGENNISDAFQLFNKPKVKTGLNFSGLRKKKKFEG